MIVYIMSCPLRQAIQLLQIESEAAEKEAQKVAEVERLHMLEADYKATLERLQSSMQQAEQQSALQARPLCHTIVFLPLFLLQDTTALPHSKSHGQARPQEHDRMVI